MNKELKGTPSSIFDASFRYRSSRETDIRKTFERIRRERAAAAKAAEKSMPVGVATIRAIQGGVVER